MKIIKPLLCLILVLVSTNGLAESKDLHVDKAWIREAPPNAKVLAAYMEIANHGPTTMVLKAASSSAFDRVEIHRTVMEQGLARMVKQDSLEIPAQGGKVVFEPGGLHFMLIGPKHAIRAGDDVELRLQFADKSEQRLLIKVKKADSSAHPHDMHHDMQHDMHHDMQHDMHHDHSMEESHEHHH